MGSSDTKDTQIHNLSKYIFFLFCFCFGFFSTHWTLHNHIYDIQIKFLLVPSLCGKQIFGGNALNSECVLVWQNLPVWCIWLVTSRQSFKLKVENRALIVDVPIADLH